MFQLDPQSSTPLVCQIVDGFRLLIDRAKLRPGSKAPSIRQFAHTQGVSIYTVVDAYDRLVALGYLISRPNSGFFVRQRELRESPNAGAMGENCGVYNFDSMWYLRRVFEGRAMRMQPGCGWLPSDWLFEDGLKRSIRAMAAERVDLGLGGYGAPKGYEPLRSLLREFLAEQQIAIGMDQLLLTHGSSQALDLVVRRLVHPGDVVLVDEPGYPNLMFSLRFMGAHPVGVPRTPQGYDQDTLSELIKKHQPKLFFTQPRMQNPTGSVASMAQLHRLLQLAEANQMTLIENDSNADLDPELRPSLASLDQLHRVIYISSYSKTVSPNLRVGFLAASPDMLEEFAQLKMIAGLTSSEFGERLAYGALIDGRWRKHLRALRDRLSEAQQKTASELEKLGFKFFCEPQDGMFIWAKHPQMANSTELAYQAAEQDILLGPGHLFMPDMRPSPWLRFNVAYSVQPQVLDFLAQARQG